MMGGNKKIEEAPSREKCVQIIALSELKAT